MVKERMDSWKWRKLGLDGFESNTEKIEGLALSILELMRKIEDLEIRISNIEADLKEIK